MSSNPSARVTPLTTARPARARRVAGRPTVQHHPEAFEPDESPGYLMHLALHSMQAQIERLMFDHDLTAMQWRPLYILSRGRAATAADLARLMQVDNGAVTRMLDRLEAKGLVARERSTTDRRVVKLSLTLAGRQRARHIPQAICRTLDTHLADFTPDEAALLKTLLRRVIANGGAAADRQAS